MRRPRPMNQTVKEINYLKKVEIDLKSKLDATSAESEKNKKLLGRDRRRKEGSQQRKKEILADYS